MALDFDAGGPAGPNSRRSAGQIGHHAGRAAEESVAQDYMRRGYPVLARRWRGRAGEIDLVMQDGAGILFVEVKKSRSFEQAIAHLSQRQMGRLRRAAEEFLGTQPLGSLTDVRFDVALVTGWGEISVMENALSH
jgi:putative endonuclease